MKTIAELVKSGLWEEFYLDSQTGAKYPKTEENTKIYLTGKVKWSSVSQKKT